MLAPANTWRRRWSVALCTALAVAYAPVMLLAEHGISAAFQFFASDAFYYLSVARHSVGLDFFSNDGLYATNGFHPLWEFLLTTLFALPSVATQEAQIVTTFAISIACVAIGSALFSVALLRLTGNAIVTFLSSSIGLYYLLFGPVDPNFNSMWSYANGMETPLSILFFGLLLYLLIERRWVDRVTRTRVLALSALLTIMTLARLDDVFVFVPFGLWLVARGSSNGERARDLALFSIVPLVGIGGYLLYNLSYMGVMMPTSGGIKAGFSLFGNARYIFNPLVPRAQFRDDLWGIGTVTTPWAAQSFRSLQMLAPMTACGIWLLKRVRPFASFVENVRRGEPMTVVAILSVYVVLKTGYSLANVGLVNQGHWYFPLCIMTFNMLAAIGAARLLEDRVPSRGRWLLSAATAILFLVAANSFTNAKWLSNYNMNFYRLWERRAEINSALATTGSKGCVEFEDGIISYSFDMPVANGFGLTLDTAGIRAIQSGRMLELAHARGFNLLASMMYIRLPRGSNLDDAALRRSLLDAAMLQPQEYDRWRFSLAHYDSASGLVVIAFHPRSEQPDSTTHPTTR